VRTRSPALQGACKSKPLVAASYLHLASSLDPQGPLPPRIRPSLPVSHNISYVPQGSAPQPPRTGVGLDPPRIGHPLPSMLGGTGEKEREGGRLGRRGAAQVEGGRGARWMRPRPPTPTPTCRSGAARVPYIYTPPHTAPDHPHPLHSAYNPPQPPRALLEAPPSPGSPCSPASLRRPPRAPVRLVEFETSLGPPPRSLRACSVWCSVVFG
jgi:hypothetical protein